jgi:hypothetical protein
MNLNEQCNELATNGLAVAVRSAKLPKSSPRQFTHAAECAFLADRIIALRTQEAREQMLAGGAL